MKSKHANTLRLAVLAFAATPFSGMAANLIHRYSFNTDGAVEDTATGGVTGGAPQLVAGTVVGTATVANGYLQTNGETDGTAYASIPGTATAGLTGSFTIQQFAAPVFQAGFYQTLSIFTRPGGDANGGSQTNILISSPVRYQGGFPSAYGFWQDGVYGGNQYLLLGIPGDSGSVLHCFTTTYDASTGTGAYYLDGVLQSVSDTGALSGFNLSLLSSIGINGRSPFNDQSLTGSTDEFRIYDGALTADQVQATAADPDLSVADFEAAGIGVPVSSASASELRILSSTFDLAAGHLDLTFASSAGTSYRITQSTDLATWTQIGADVAGSAGQTHVQLSITKGAKGFFRVEKKTTP